MSARGLFSKDKMKKGGVWEGKKAIVGLVDGSATIQKAKSEDGHAVR